MKLAQAYLCIDCDEIFSVAGQTNPACPNCASRTYAPIAGWLTTQDLADRLFARETGARRVPAAVSLAVAVPVAVSPAVVCGNHHIMARDPADRSEAGDPVASSVARGPGDRALVRRYEFPDFAVADQQGKERSWRH